MRSVISSNISSAILKARATSIQIGLPGSIYRSASQTTELLDSLFSLEDGFLNLTQQIYVSLVMTAGVCDDSSYFELADPISRCRRKIGVPHTDTGRGAYNCIRYCTGSAPCDRVCTSLLNLRLRR